MSIIFFLSDKGTKAEMDIGWGVQPRLKSNIFKPCGREPMLPNDPDIFKNKIKQTKKPGV